MILQTKSTKTFNFGLKNNEQMKNIERKDYMNTLIELRDKNLTKVLTGVRRYGKSTVLQMFRVFRDYLIADGVAENRIVFLNFEDFENRKWLFDFKDLSITIKGLNTAEKSP